MGKFIKVLCEGRELRLTNLDKPLWPREGVTKAEMIKYYYDVAPYLLKYLKDRPLTLHRFPNGIEGEGFFEKQKPVWTPKWVKTFARYSKSLDKEIEYIVCNDLPTLVWLANLANLEFNPTLSRIDDFEHPDFVVFDLDPFKPAGFEDARQVALVIRDGLRSLGLKSQAKTSGATGIQIFVPIKRTNTFDQTKEFVRRIGAMIEKLMPEKVISRSLPLELRKGKVFIDPLQNSPTKTIVAPYSLRPLPGAPVSTPVSWEELESGLDPKEFNLRTIRERLKLKGDLFGWTLAEKQKVNKVFVELKITKNF
jgi:bifunctional non-homologous end joining protein LigD